MGRTSFLIVSNTLVARGGGSSRPRDKGQGGDGLQKIFLGLRVSVWSKNMWGGGGGGNRGPLP